MYRYDQYDQAMVDARVAEFRDQARRRLEGKLSEDQFKPLRLMNGLYLQLHAYMLRVAIPYGTLSSAQMRMLGAHRRRYDRGYGHFTTRQNIQYNWIKLEERPTSSPTWPGRDARHPDQRQLHPQHQFRPVAGAAADELIDPRPYAELMRQWSSFHPEFSYLPRKFKIAVIASNTDRAAMRCTTSACASSRTSGEIGFEVYVGGGMGRTPFIAPLIRDSCRLETISAMPRPILRVYNRYGRRDNIYKARIKILVHELGQGRIRPPGRGRVRAPPGAGPRLPAGRVRPHPRLLRRRRRSRPRPDHRDRPSDPDFACGWTARYPSRTRRRAMPSSTSA
jgi:sulfite reductase (NADPH) hemoprotein beta-component